MSDTKALNKTSAEEDDENLEEIEKELDMIGTGISNRKLAEDSEA